MKTPFSTALKKYRKEAGFRTAYQFYHRNGGRAVFKVSYRGWLLTEAGKTLPKLRNLGAIAHALRIISYSGQWMDLISSWLKTTHGEEEFKQFIDPILKPQKETFPSPLHKALRKSLSHRKFYITTSQAEALTHDANTHLCWTMLSNDIGRWTNSTLASEIGISVKEAGKILSRLYDAELLKKVGPKAYRCHMAGSMLEFPSDNGSSPVMAKLMEMRNELISSGRTIFFRNGILRADLADFSNFFPMMALNLSAADPYSVTKKSRNTGLFAVMGQVIKIRDF